MGGRIEHGAVGGGTVGGATVLAVLLGASAFAGGTAQAAGGKVLAAGGANVAVADTLSSGLATSATAQFTTTATGTAGISCTTSTISAAVSTNPAAPGTATASMGFTVGGCASTLPNPPYKLVSAAQIKNGPFPTSFADTINLPVSVAAGATGSFSATFTIATSIGNIICVYASAAIAGNYANANNTVQFTAQYLPRTGGAAACPAGVYFTATYGPLADTTMAGAPSVTVN